MLMSYLSEIYSESWLSWLGGEMQKILRKRRIQTEKKALKNKDKEKRRIQGKSNNNNEHFYCSLLFEKIYFAQKHSLKKTSLYHHILSTVFMCWRIF